MLFKFSPILSIEGVIKIDTVIEDIYIMVNQHFPVPNESAWSFWSGPLELEISQLAGSS